MLKQESSADRRNGCGGEPTPGTSDCLVGISGYAPARVRVGERSGAMRVLLVHNFYRIPGGEDSVVREEFSLLRRNGVDVDLFSVSNDDIHGALGALVAGLSLIYNPSALRALARKLAEFAPDVVHVHNFFPRLSPSIFDACRGAGIPVVMTLHNFRILCPAALLHPQQAFRERSLTHSCWWTVPRKVYRNSAVATLAVAAMVEFHKWNKTWPRKVDRFIALSNFAKDVFVKGGLPAERIVVKPNCIASPPALDGPPRRGALFVGRLDEQKGVPTLLKAWTDIDYPLTIIGDGPLADVVARAVNVRVLGRQPRAVVQKEMRAAKFLVLPSVGQEMFPITALEAFANRLPVICSDLASLSDIVSHGANGLTFVAGSARALADRVLWAINNPKALDEIGGRARSIFEQRYTSEANFEYLLRIYQAVISSASVSGRHAFTDALPHPS